MPERVARRAGSVDGAAPADRPASIPLVLPLVLLLAGCGLLAGAGLLLRGAGPGLRIGRLLSAAPQVGIGEALRIARDGETRYVRVTGRITSDEEFPDEHDRPLVFRRRRVELAVGGRWATLEDDREAVPFGVRDREGTIGVDLGAIDEGLVVLPRVSAGTAAEVPDHVPPGTPPGSAVRLRIEQVSAVEHAHLAGVPALDRAGSPVIGAGLGRPLVLSTLDVPEAMRLLGGGRRARPAAVVAGLGGGAALLVAAAVAAALRW